MVKKRNFFALREFEPAADHPRESLSAEMVRRGQERVRLRRMGRLTWCRCRTRVCADFDEPSFISHAQVSTIQALSFLLVGAFWGCTNPLLKRESEGIEEICGGWSAVRVCTKFTTPGTMCKALDDCKAQ